jgi:hypothetical protein
MESDLVGIRLLKNPKMRRGENYFFFHMQYVVDPHDPEPDLAFYLNADWIQGANQCGSMRIQILPALKSP